MSPFWILYSSWFWFSGPGSSVLAILLHLISGSFISSLSLSLPLPCFLAFFLIKPFLLDVFRKFSICVLCDDLYSGCSTQDLGMEGESAITCRNLKLWSSAHLPSVTQPVQSSSMAWELVQIDLDSSTSRADLSYKILLDASSYYRVASIFEFDVHVFHIVILFTDSSIFLGPIDFLDDDLCSGIFSCN
ncbi:unnamed protein product [Protopolystoma xenopodis]|uniref:Uncharacterized protein n=1 Tax=Protopolystoma xenopodis TaxID=117903 RepID=A0A448WWD7_9PLAT|nr:unnamed protein product [Protopolystoma xenopodis]